MNRKRVIGTNHRNQGEKVMPQYLVANYLPDDFDPSTVSEAMIEEIHVLNREMIDAGVSANFFSFRRRNKDPAKASKQSGRGDFGRFDVLTIGGTSQREATPLAPSRKEEEKNSEIPLFWLLRQRQIRWND